MSYKSTDRFENWFITSLQTDVSDTTSSFRLNRALNVHQGRLVIDPYDETKREIVKVTSVDGNLVYVERGDDNTVPEYHNEGTIVAMHVFAADMNELLADWAEFEIEMQDAIDAANTATSNATSATSAANTATSSANIATASANNAAADATLATGAATTATANANTAASNATSATSAANSATTRANNAAEAAEGVVGEIESVAFLASHPVGSTYWNATDSRNPGTVWGGTWIHLDGVVLGGRSSSGAFNVAAGTIIGSDTHTLTEAQLPNITGRFDIADNVAVNSSASNPKIGTTSGVFSSSNTTSNTVHNTSSSVSSTSKRDRVNMSFGSGSSHNNIQRTKVGYLWQRTA